MERAFSFPTPTLLLPSPEKIRRRIIFSSSWSAKRESEEIKIILPSITISIVTDVPNFVKRPVL